MTEANDPELRPEETVDRLEDEALRAEAPRSKGLTDSAREPGAREPGGWEPGDEDGAEPAFDQDLDVEDLPGEDGSTPEPSG